MYTRFSFLVWQTLFIGAGLAFDATGQSSGVNLNITNKKITDVFAAIEKQSHVLFTYDKEQMDRLPVISINTINISLGEVLRQLEEQTGIQFRQTGNLIGVSFTPQYRANITGKVTDAKGEPLPGVNVIVKGNSTIGTSTNVDGKFVLYVHRYTPLLLFSYIGYVSREVAVSDSGSLLIILAEDINKLDEIVVSVGSRGVQRTVTDSPLAIDNLSMKELAATGQVTFDKALQYRVPSFNTVNTPVIDATSLFDPYELRNLGPSRALILINGKRKNLSSLVYVQASPGRGETGTDLSVIPTGAVKRVEVLRDGAAAQYGSDAIAGVMNVILKDRFEASEINITSGITSKGDGFNYGVNYNSGANIGEKGFINYNISFLNQNKTNRPGIIDPVGESNAGIGFGKTVNSDPGKGDIVTQADVDAQDKAIKDYLQRFPDANNINGQPNNTSAKFLLNMALPLGEKSEFYANAAYVYRKSISNANFRTPYWRQDYGLLHQAGTEYIGYRPTFEGDLNDYNATAGFKGTTKSGWKYDMSLTTGGNQMLFTVNNTVNHSLQAKSPTSFKPGGFSFNHIVGNMDFSKAVTSRINIAMGSEFRMETFRQIAGDTASYSGQGANSFFGFSANNAITANRSNLGLYLDATWDITDKFLVNGTIRSEKYSDFGDALVWKASSRYKFFEDKLILRGSVSTGFRAPTLHQTYLQLNQQTFLVGTIRTAGLANNISREAHILGIPKLNPERSVNFTAGLGLNPTQHLSFTADYYNIDISDRIVYSHYINQGINAELDALLLSVNSTGVSFFINGVHTNTQGIDMVISYKNITLAPEISMNLNMAGNYTLENKLVGSPQTPAVIANAGGSILTATEIALMLTSRPQYKYILGFDFSIGKKLGMNLNNTLFGPTSFSNYALADYGNLDKLKVEFSPNVLTDLGATYAFTSKVVFSFTVQNLLNIYPKWNLVALNAAGEAVLNNPTALRLQIDDLTFNGRYNIVTYDGSQFNQLGTNFQSQLLLKF